MFRDVGPLARRQDASAEKTLPHVDYIKMFTSGSVKGFGFVFHFKKKKKSVFAALTLLVGSINKREVPLRFSLMGLKKDPGASARVVFMCFGSFVYVCIAVKYESVVHYHFVLSRNHKRNCFSVSISSTEPISQACIS